MSETHEADVARRLGGWRSPGSGNQWANQTDGRRDRFTYLLGWAWDCKATLRRSASITLDMLSKITEQSGYDKPTMPIRFYKNERLTDYEDWILVRLDDFIEVLELLDGSD